MQKRMINFYIAKNDELLMDQALCYGHWPSRTALILESVRDKCWDCLKEIGKAEETRQKLFDMKRKEK